MVSDGKSPVIVWHGNYVSRQDYEERNGHRAAVIWMTGLSGAGKSSIAQGVERGLFARGCYVKVIDGDNTRHGLNRDLGFSSQDRKENVRRIGELAKLFFDGGFIVVAALISPFKSDRDAVRALFPEGSFFEVYIKCDLETCIQRDPKGLYKKALSGTIRGYTGIDSPYEAPDAPDIVIETSNDPLEDSVGAVVRFISGKNIIEQ